MKTSKSKSTTGSVLANLAGISLLAAAAFAIVGAGMVQAAYVTIGDAGNTADSTGYGAVGYTYQISATEVSNNDYTSVMSGGSGDNTPKVSISLYGAMEYANALTEAEHGGVSTYNVYDLSGTGYTINYSRSDALTDGNLVYAIPTENEWYKAAYGNAGATEGDFSVYSDYANGDDTGDGDPTVGTTGTAHDGWNYNNAIGSAQDVGFSPAEQNGTYDMMGNVWEWQEDTGGVARGGFYASAADNLRSSSGGAVNDPARGYQYLGFRVVAIPEPASGALLVLVGGMLWFVRRSRGC